MSEAEKRAAKDASATIRILIRDLERGLGIMPAITATRPLVKALVALDKMVRDANK